jgi:type II secretory pathway predicted ATPase ExeA
MQHLEQLIRFLSSNDPLLLVVANGAQGKSSLLREVVAQTEMALPIVSISGRSTIRTRGLLAQLAEVWGLPLSLSRAADDEQIEGLVHCLARRQQKGILIIDDAHLLPYSFLSALVSVIMQQQDDCHLQCVLAGRLSLVDKVQVLCEEPCFVMQLGMLTPREIRKRVVEFLDQVGVKVKQAKINHVVDQLNITAQGDTALLERKLQSLALTDFMDEQQLNQHCQASSMAWAVPRAQSQARMVAVIALFCTIGFSKSLSSSGSSGKENSSI